MLTVYMKVTIPALAEAVRVSWTSCMSIDGCPFKTIAEVRRMAALRGVGAEYDLITKAEYLAGRQWIRDETARLTALNAAAMGAK